MYIRVWPNASSPGARLWRPLSGAGSGTRLTAGPTRRSNRADRASEGRYVPTVPLHRRRRQSSDVTEHGQGHFSAWHICEMSGKLVLLVVLWLGISVGELRVIYLLRLCFVTGLWWWDDDIDTPVSSRRLRYSRRPPPLHICLRLPAGRNTPPNSD